MAQAEPQPSADSAAAEATACARAELSRVHAQLGTVERALQRRETEHRSDLEALCAAQRDAEDAHRTLMSERAWVASLDEMRLDDLSTIMSLEMRLQQWQARFEQPAADRFDEAPRGVEHGVVSAGARRFLPVLSYALRAASTGVGRPVYMLARARLACCRLAQ